MKEIKSQDSENGKIRQVIESAEDSKIPFTIIKKYAYECQAHFERIINYLILGEGVWWFKDNSKNVVFYDKRGRIPAFTIPKPFHFRSTSITTIEQSLGK